MRLLSGLNYSRVILALVIGTSITGFGAYTFMQNSYHMVPQTWDQRVGDQAERGSRNLASCVHRRRWYPI